MCYTVFIIHQSITASPHRKSTPAVTTQGSCSAQVSNIRYILNLRVISKCLFALTSYTKCLLLLCTKLNDMIFTCSINHRSIQPTWNLCLHDSVVWSPLSSSIQIVHVGRSACTDRLRLGLLFLSLLYKEYKYWLLIHFTETKLEPIKNGKKYFETEMALLQQEN